MDGLQRSGEAQMARMREIAWVAGAVLTGELGVVPAFARAARYAGEVEAELRKRRRLLEQAREAYAR